MKKCPVRILVRRGCKVRYCDIGHTMDIDHATLRAMKRISCEKKEEKKIKKDIDHATLRALKRISCEKKKPLGKLVVPSIYFTNSVSF